MPVGPAGKNPIADRSYDANVVKSENRMWPGVENFCNRSLVSPSYDQSAVTWPRFTMSVRPNPQTPYDANSGKSTTSKKFVTDAARALPRAAQVQSSRVGDGRQIVAVSFLDDE